AGCERPPIDAAIDTTDDPMDDLRVVHACPSLDWVKQGSWAAGPSEVAPATLSETGLYCDISRLVPATGVRSFRPRFALWSDGAQKRRFIQLPPGTQIDA